MRKYVHILISAILAVTLLHFGAGVMVERCLHSGTVKLLVEKLNDCCHEEDPHEGNNCMAVENLHFSPTVLDDVQPSISPSLQPALAVVDFFITCWHEPSFWERQTEYVEQVVWKPPRVYLNWLSTLLI